MQKVCYRALFLSLMASLASGVWAADRVVVKGLFAGTAVLEVNGTSHLLKEGHTSPEGITLIHATSQYAEIDQNGQHQRLELNNDVGALYSDAPVASVSLDRQPDGHFMGSGKVNDRWVEFMVDTGATSVTLNSFAAEQMGVDYEKGSAIEVSTAQGNIQAYEVVLNSITVGDVSVKQVSALVIKGRFPKLVLLGNSFLSRINLQVDNTTMTLQAKD